MTGVVIAGIGSTPYYKRGESPWGATTLILQAALAACEDAGISPREIDGFVSYANDLKVGLAMGAALGVDVVRWSTLVWGGGGGGVTAAVNAAGAAVRAGEAECVLVYRGITERDDGRQSYGKGHFGPHQSAHGILAPAQICALRTQRMLEVDGVPRSALEALVLASYHHGARNPASVAHGSPLTQESYDDARLISEPLRLYDCSRENDGASAVLVTSADRGGPSPVHLLAGVQGAGRGWSESAENEDAYTSAGFHPAMVQRLWDRAGITAADVDVTQVYENFSGPAVASLIDVGLVPPGPAAADVMVVDNLLAQGGSLPINTAGGNLAEGFVHGIGLVLEAVRQVRGASVNQVQDVRHSLLLGGPMAPLVSALVLGREPARRS